MHLCSEVFIDFCMKPIGDRGMSYSTSIVGSTEMCGAQDELNNGGDNGGRGGGWTPRSEGSADSRRF